MAESSAHPNDLLLRFVENDLAPAQEERVAEHVARCPECQDWCEAFAVLDSDLRASADRHPSADSIARYVIAPETLDEEKRQSLHSHLASCDLCREDEALVAEGVDGKPLGYEAQGVAMRLLTSRPLQIAASLLLLVGVLASPLFRESSGQPAAQMQVDGQLLEGQRVIEAGVRVEVTDTAVALGSDIVFRAGDTVALGNGFSIAEGASFSVETGIAKGDADSG